MQKPSDNPLKEDSIDLIRLSFDFDNFVASFDTSIWLVVAVVLVLFGFWVVGFRLKRYKLVKLNISLGKIGKAEFAPNVQDIQIAHKIWTELVTRKAALPLEPEHDVLVEVYDSWYALFTKVRALISEVPADLLRKEKSTQELVRISTATLNDGLRPHLTRWQARFRNWYQSNAERLKDLTPQELQREYPDYDDLVKEMVNINEELISYAKELKKIVDGKST
jgi:hypothetical protein